MTLRSIYWDSTAVDGDDAVAYNRSILPAQFLPSSDQYTLHMSDRLDPRDHFDCYILHRPPSPSILPFIYRAKEQGKKLILGLDDDLFHLPPWNNSYKYFDYPVLDALKLFLGWADGLIVSTEPLKAVLGYPDKSLVVENRLDMNEWGPPTRHHHEEVRILWTGGQNHVGDLAVIADLWDQLLDRSDVQLFIYGYLPPDLKPHPRLTHIPYSHRNSYAKILRLIAPDIGLLPLEDNVFNASKSNLKWLELTAAGAATVASPVGPYQEVREAIEGLQAEPGQWLRQVERLIRCPELRVHCHRQSWDRIKQRYLWPNPAWGDDFLALLGEPVAQKPLELRMHGSIATGEVIRA